VLSRNWTADSCALVCSSSTPIRIQEQPLKLLLCLLDTPGEICSREELIRTIWPEGTFVDYERGLNAAVTRLRQVMGDSADAPRYVETIGRRGYRFIAPVERMSPPEMAPPVWEGIRPSGEPQTTPSSQEVASQRRLSRFGAHAAMLVIGLATGGAVGWWRATLPVTSIWNRR
jgi:DNA-binding winged helix-turn-helix (wHTH) protein